MSQFKAKISLLWDQFYAFFCPARFVSGFGRHPFHLHNHAHPVRFVARISDDVAMYPAVLEAWRFSLAYDTRSIVTRSTPFPRCMAVKFRLHDSISAKYSWKWETKNKIIIHSHDKCPHRIYETLIMRERIISICAFGKCIIYIFLFIRFTLFHLLLPLINHLLNKYHPI